MQASPAPQLTEQQGLSKTASGEMKAPTPAPAPTAGSKKDYKGFVAGVFSGITKLSGKLIYSNIFLNFCG